MPLSWMFSSMILLVLVLVILLMYSMNYYNMMGHSELNKNISFFLWW